MANSLAHRVIWVVIFAVAMGFLEAAVVVYLRELYYPNGFAFPLVVLDPHIGLVEIGREAATLIMLAALGMLAGNKFRERLAFFLISFAVWDLFYYVFLKLTLDWPVSLLTWDILFLIPAPWVGPVLSPILACITMVGLAALILLGERRGQPYPIRWQQWALLVGGSLVVIAAWLWEYVELEGAIRSTAGEAVKALSTHVPQEFNWWLFGFGQATIAVGILQYFGRGIKSRS